MPDQEQSPELDSPVTQPEAHPTGAPPVGAVLDSPTVEPASPGDTDSTVGTGTSIALGCVVGTIVLIVFGLIFLGIVALFN
jgi:hypothetical protein